MKTVDDIQYNYHTCTLHNEREIIISCIYREKPYFFNSQLNVQVGQVPESSEGIFECSLEFITLNEPVDKTEIKVK